MKKHHAINYIELPAKNLAAMKKFYGAAFGWKFKDYGPEYVEFRDGVLTGGFTAGTISGTKGPLVILYSKKLDTTFKAVQEAGAKIQKKIFAFPGGRRFHFADPAGNVLAVWSQK